MNKKIIQLNGAVLALSAFLLLSPVVVLAQGVPSLDFAVIAGNIQSYIFEPLFYGIITAVFFYAGILYLTARGEPGKVQKANTFVLWGVVGVAVGLLANVMVSFVTTVLGG